MKEINGKFYAKIDIKQSGSFMVVSNENLEDEEIYGRCLDNDLIEAEDIDFADIDTFISSNITASHKYSCGNCRQRNSRRYIYRFDFHFTFSSDSGPGIGLRAS